MKHADYDSPWKEIIEQFFPEFIAFFFPHIFADIDWSRGYEFLDKELQKIVRDSQTVLVTNGGAAKYNWTSPP